MAGDNRSHRRHVPLRQALLHRLHIAANGFKCNRRKSETKDPTAEDKTFTWVPFTSKASQRPSQSNAMCNYTDVMEPDWTTIALKYPLLKQILLERSISTEDMCPFSQMPDFKSTLNGVSPEASGLRSSDIDKLNASRETVV